jgi:hypothetical protein
MHKICPYGHGGELLDKRIDGCGLHVGILSNIKATKDTRPRAEA